MMKKRPFSRVLSLKNGLFLVEVRRLELRASWSQKVPNAQYIVLFSSLMCFLLQNMEPRGALWPQFLHCIRVLRAWKWDKLWSKNAPPKR